MLPPHPPAAVSGSWDTDYAKYMAKDAAGNRPTAANFRPPCSHLVGFAEKMTITRRKAPITAPRNLAKCQCKQRRVVPSRMLPVDSARVSERIQLLTLVDGRRKDSSALW